MIPRGVDKFPYPGDRIGANAYIPLPFDGWQTKMQISSFWDQAAPGYSLHMRQFYENEKDTSIVKWKLLFHDLIGTRSIAVLDAGCGPGLFSVMLCEMGHIVTGIDLSHPMIAAAREFAAEKNARPTLKRGDLELLLFDDDSFDLVLCCDVLWSVLHPQRVVHEFRRVLRPGGRVILIDRVPRFPGLGRFNTSHFFTSRGLSEIGPCVSPGVSLSEWNNINSFRSSSLQRLESGLNMLEEAGFTRITQNTGVRIPSFGFDSWFGDIFSRNILVTGLHP
ncbi:class I SAM-dependent methyltransferase [uncultured Methanospirillum sp.]|uniref:class I SAM-dependent methyltransferase n=1 Tax=uncultured Methanospirillum sp. TaxID=262503 RepID=UPI0029C77138|nr:class I SAM-dependent methyltransferase [uncultured Methanospirillum sp.]